MEGLSAEEARTRKERIGPNRLPSAAKQNEIRRFLRQFHNLLIYVLLCAAVLAASIGHYDRCRGDPRRGRGQRHHRLSSRKAAAERALEAIRAMIDPRSTVVARRPPHGHPGRGHRSRRSRAASSLATACRPISVLMRDAKPAHRRSGADRQNRCRWTRAIEPAVADDPARRPELRWRSPGPSSPAGNGAGIAAATGSHDGARPHQRRSSARSRR